MELTFQPPLPYGPCPFPHCPKCGYRMVAIRESRYIITYCNKCFRMDVDGEQTTYGMTPIFRSESHMREIYPEWEP